MSSDAQPTRGYAPVNGLQLYYEMRGEGLPLVLLHGGLHTIELSFEPMITPLAAHRQVVAIELQGHGRTADVDREMTLEHFADDVAGVLDHLGIDRADVLGFSLGGLTALQLAVSQPDRVRRLVLAATHYRDDGYHPEITNPDPELGSTRLPTQADFEQMQDAYARVSPQPDQFYALAAKAQGMVHPLDGWTDEELGALGVPTLIIVGDHDFVRLDHAVSMMELVPGAQLAVLPGTTHMDVVRRVELVVPMVERFLDASA